MSVWSVGCLRRWILACLITTLVFAPVSPVWAVHDKSPAVQGSGFELLKNPGLDGPVWFKSQCCGEDGLPINEVQVAEGWTAWWRQAPPDDVVLPDNCQERRQVDDGCYWARPEFVDAARTGVAQRIYRGDNAQKYFSFGRMHEAGLYQRVTGVVSGTLLHFSVYMSAWMCANHSDCQNGLRSDQPATMHLRIGIDPTGHTDPFSPDVVWLSEMDSFDRWTQYHVEAVARGDAVTVFTHSRPEWTWPRLHNDVYVDEASLMALDSAGLITTTTGSSLSSLTPHGRSTPRLGEAVVYAQAGDTLFSIALAYGVTAEELARINGLRPNDPLEVGQPLTLAPALSASAVRLPLQKAVLTMTAESRQPPVALATAPPVSTTLPASGQICVQVYIDWNDNGLQDSGDELLASAILTVFKREVAVASHTTDGISEPYCFTGLASGEHVVRASVPKGYVLAFDIAAMVPLASGQMRHLAFGARPAHSDKPTNGRPSWATVKVAFATACVVVLLVVLILAAKRGWRR